MTLTLQERARLRVLWRTLARAGVKGDVDEIKAQAAGVMDWRSPLDDPADAYVLFALARLAWSYGRERSEAGRALRRPALSALAMLAGDLLDATDPAAPAPAPICQRLPYAED